MTTFKTKDEELREGQSSDHPLLLICHGKVGQKQILYNMSEKSQLTYSLPSMRNKKVVACNFGWLLLDDYDQNGDCFLFNLGSKDKVNLPKNFFDYNACIFTSTPTDPECRILFLDYRSDGTLLRFCKVGDDKFLEQKLEIDHNGSFLSTIIAFNGKVYGIVASMRHVLVEIEFIIKSSKASLQFRQVIHEICNHPLGRSDLVRYRSYLVESGDELLFVYQTYLGYEEEYDLEAFDFIVFRADFERGEWIEMTNLRDRALFLCETEGKSCSAISHNNIKENCIYFVSPNNRNLNVFDMEDQSISISEPCRMVDNHNLSLHWISM